MKQALQGVTAARKTVKYSQSDQYTFHPVTAETQGALNESAYELWHDLGRRIARFLID